MRWAIGSLVFAVGVGALPTPAHSIEFETRIKRVYRGFVVSKTDKQLYVRLEGKSDPEPPFELSEITIHSQLDRARLEKLVKDKPGDYFNYAKELAKRTTDPEARDTALRLFLIAAYLKPDEYGERSLLAMSPLASTGAEARRYEAMAFVLSSKAKGGAAKKELPKYDDKAFKSFQECMRSYWKGNMERAVSFAEHPGVDSFFGTKAGTMEHRAFVKMCKDAAKCGKCKGRNVHGCETCNSNNVSQIVFDKNRLLVLRTELAALAPGEVSIEQNDWGAAFDTGQIGRAPVLELEAISDHRDPRAYLFDNYKWKTP